MQLKTLAFLLLVAFAAAVEFTQETKSLNSKYFWLHIGILNGWLDKQNNRMESSTFATNALLLPAPLPPALLIVLRELPRLEEVANHWVSELQDKLAALDIRLIISATLNTHLEQQLY
jgi:hypothetical protein